MNFFKSSSNTVDEKTDPNQPKYEVIQKGEGYEERYYPQSVWVTTRGSCYKEASSAGFWRLFKYIGGENQTKSKIPMTKPVALKMDARDEVSGESTYSLSFYINEEFQDKPPAPNNPDVFTETWPAFGAYVRTFGGYTSEKTNREHIAQLKGLLPPGTVSNEDYCIGAGYDSPVKLFNRRNEVWLIKKDTGSS